MSVLSIFARRGAYVASHQIPTESLQENPQIISSDAWNFLTRTKAVGTTSGHIWKGVLKRCHEHVFIIPHICMSIYI